MEKCRRTKISLNELSSWLKIMKKRKRDMEIRVLCCERRNREYHDRDIMVNSGLS